MMNSLLPIREIDAAFCQTIEGIAFDVDDTLTYDGRLQSAAYEQLWALQRHGIRALALTGRPSGWAHVWAFQWPVTGVVAENGACGWFRDGKQLNPIFAQPDAEVRARHRERLQQAFLKAQHKFPWVKHASDQCSRACDLAIDIGETQTVEPAQVRACMDLIQADGLHTLTSSVHLHVNVNPTDKVEGAQLLLRSAANYDLDVHKSRWLFVGDSPNDSSAFAWFASSAGVANVRNYAAVLKHWPKYVATASHGEGFAEIVRTILTKNT